MSDQIMVIKKGIYAQALAASSVTSAGLTEDGLPVAIRLQKLNEGLED